MGWLLLYLPAAPRSILALVVALIIPRGATRGLANDVLGCSSGDECIESDESVVFLQFSVGRLRQSVSHLDLADASSRPTTKWNSSLSLRQDFSTNKTKREVKRTTGLHQPWWSITAAALRSRNPGALDEEIAAQINRGINETFQVRKLPDPSMAIPSQATQQEYKEVCVPEEVGSPPIAEEEAFQLQVTRGRDAAKSKGIVMAGLARQIDTSVHSLFEALRQVGGAFHRYHIILLENDSTDRTRQGMEVECAFADSWCFQLDLPLLALQAQDQENPNRVRHFTLLRQALLQEVRYLTASAPDQWDFVLMFDGDIFAEGNTGFNPVVVVALMGLPAPVEAQKGSGAAVFAEAPLDVVCANQLAYWPEPGRYRDTFSLRNSSWEESFAVMQAPPSYFMGNRLFKLKSCFSGLAVYSLKALLETGCNYTFQGEGVCEHVAFHRCMAERGRQLVALYPPLAVQMNDRIHPSTGVSAVSRVPETVCAQLPSNKLVSVQEDDLKPTALEVWHNDAA